MPPRSSWVTDDRSTSRGGPLAQRRLRPATTTGIGRWGGIGTTDRPTREFPLLDKVGRADENHSEPRMRLSAERRSLDRFRKYRKATPMRAIAVDADILRTTAAASAHAYEQTIKHVEAEIMAANGALEPLIDTLTAHGPYAYTILPEVHPDGSVKLPILTTREEIADAYAMIRGASNLIEVVGVTEVRGAWYTFQDALSRGSLKGTDKVDVYETLGLFPSGRGPGITGELVWIRVPPSALGTTGAQSTVMEDPLLAREKVFRQHELYLTALRDGHVDVVLD